MQQTWITEVIRNLLFNFHYSYVSDILPDLFLRLFMDSMINIIASEIPVDFLSAYFFTVSSLTSEIIVVYVTEVVSE